MATILLTGAGGQLGGDIRKWHENDPIKGRNRLISTDVKDMDITDYVQVASVVGAQNVDLIINCAAYTAVDKAESEPERARHINAGGCGVLAHAARAYNVPLIHISTDYVFDGTKKTPYTESDTPSPRSVYGQTKLEGEQAIQRSGCRHMIIRTSWLYSSIGLNFVKTMMRLGREKGEVSVVDDQWGSPTYSGDLADFIMRKAAPRLLSTHQYAEIYNYSNAGIATWCGFARRIMEYAGIECAVNPIHTADYPSAAARPQYSLLDKSKVMKDFGVTIPEWEDSLKICIKKIIE